MKNTIAFEGSFNLKLESVTSQIAKPLIKARDVTLERGQAKVLKGINFVVEQDDHILLVGPSGQGKSVLLKIMAGLLEISRGELFFEGENWSELSITQRNRHYLKNEMVFQKNALFDSKTMRENIFFQSMRSILQSNQVQMRLVNNAVVIGDNLAYLTNQLRGKKAAESFEFLHKLIWRLEPLDKEALKKFFQEEGVKAKIL
jgi:ABC-type transporter Mla maintaining outer membrane lipid asymmetry ATPase subunit MlaF